MKFNRVVFAALAAAALTACGGHANDAVTFTAPAGYVSQASVGPFVQIWAGPNRQVMMLTAMPYANGDLNSSFDKYHKGSLNLESRQSITICNNQPAMLALGTGKPGAPMDGPPNSKFELLATVAGGKTYLAMYSRPSNAPADPAAEKAIKNVCPK